MEVCGSKWSIFWKLVTDGHGTEMYFLNFLFCEKRQGLEPHFFFGVVPDQTSCGAITTMHGCVLGHPGRHSPYDPLQRCPLQMFFSVRAPSHSLQNAAFLLTHFSFGGKVVGFFDPIITSCRPSECTKHICGGCSHTQVRHIFSHAECPECGCGKVFDDGMCHNRMRLTRPNMAQPLLPMFAMVPVALTIIKEL